MRQVIFQFLVLSILFNSFIPSVVFSIVLSLFLEFHNICFCESKDEDVVAYLLAVLGENTNPTADDLKKILSSIGAKVNENRI